MQGEVIPFEKIQVGMSANYSQTIKDIDIKNSQLSRMIIIQFI